ncbi:hypothetical protein [Adlercreutzia mucosicola]|uniref:hypothetical protein n=1 Tax=Adlercreutzia mucosicola TaxID=580026 RepID=UPI0003F84F16|nr:hypothetical protein [Adlercreutzia mucosicola]MCR2034380.1 hypothetical protein [Adlercreutzia mucosicola]
MSSIGQILDSIKAEVDETKADLEPYALEDAEPPSEIETPVLDALLEDVRDIIEGRKEARRYEREKALYERRMAGDWS